MKKLTCLLQEFIEDESGLTAVEYAIAGGLVVGGMVTAFITLGDSAEARIDDLCEAVNGTASTAGAGDCVAPGGTTTTP
ncbi:Flp family type IVb pilin [Alteromonas ponticola]|uniref:Flp family type IVb pilin n=1 Tax=Alteromonas aquimaris TaxID=2998417 RepID=A0ABT3P9E1_9ALTE|nr:Flp family type IVb pilin [Alteromonas aquimaris]MCW8109364.1 Flp family type IVb pilin [Alteromonas aquimaris]